MQKCFSCTSDMIECAFFDSVRRIFSICSLSITSTASTQYSGNFRCFIGMELRLVWCEKAFLRASQGMALFVLNTSVHK